VHGLNVTVCYADSDAVWQVDLVLPAGVTAAQAVAASGFRAVFADVDPLQHGLAIYGQTVPPERVLHQGDRVEILRPLIFDPKESRRRRAAHRREAQALKKPETR